MPSSVDDSRRHLAAGDTQRGSETHYIGVRKQGCDFQTVPKTNLQSLGVIYGDYRCVCVGGGVPQNRTFVKLPLE